MKGKHRIFEFLSIRPGEGSRIVWLSLHSLCNGIFVAFFFSTAYALFLDRFEVTDLPLAYIISAVMGFGAIALFSRLETRMPSRNLLTLVLFFLLALVVVYWGAVVVSGHRWIVFLMFISLGPSMTLLELEFWGLATSLFDLRQGKRLFGLGSTGEVVSSIVGFLLVPVLLRYVAQPVHLLLVSAAGMVGCLVVLRVVIGRFREEVSSMREAPEQRARGEFSTFLRDRYFVLMAALMLLLVAAFYLVDLGFLNQVRARFPSTESVAQFIGLFYGTIKVIELLVRVLLSGRVVSHLGIKFGLLILPLVLFSFAFLASVIGTLSGTEATLFLLLVASSKLVWLVLRKSLSDPSFRVLYQPLAGDQKLAFQARVGSVSQVGSLVVGLILLLFSKTGFNALYLFYLSLPVFAAWMVVVTRLHREYRTKLLDNLSAETPREVATSPVEILTHEVRSGVPEDLGYHLNLLDQVDPTAVEPLLGEKLDDPVALIRVGILRRIERTRALGSRELVERHAEEGNPRAVRKAAEHTLETLREIAALAGAPERLSALVRSSDPAARVRAAVALGWAQGEWSHGILAGLLWDRNWELRRAALRAAGRSGHPRFWPQIVSHLSQPAFATAATFALITIGEPVVPELETAFRRGGQAREVRLRILKIYAHIGGAKVRELLWDKLRYPDREIRHRVLCALNALGSEVGSEHLSAVTREIEEVVGTLVWNLSALLDLDENGGIDAVREALEGEITQNRATIFLLLARLYDSQAIDLARENIESDVSEAAVYALEILDLLISSELKPILFPVLEDLRPAQCLRRLGPFYPKQRLDRDERLSSIVLRDPSRLGGWTKACAIQAIGKLSSGEVPDILIANLFHPEPMLQELAAWSIHQLDPEAYARHAAKLPFDDRERLARRIDAAAAGEEDRNPLSHFDRVLVLAGARGFSDLPRETLVKVAECAEERGLEPGKILPSEDDPEGTFYVVVEGLLGVLREEGSPGVAVRSMVAAKPLTEPVQALETTRLLRLDGDQLLELVADHPMLVPATLKAGVQRPVRELTAFSTHHSGTMALKDI
ncbi:MAG: hypothetical protein GY856_04075 [bacterium]|nr:hypothetical protein [bacterium]